MKLLSIKTVAITALMSVSSAFAAAPAIGVASAFGSFSVNGAQVNGNSNLNNGSEISTGRTASQIFLEGGPSVMLATNTGATVYNDHLVLSQGAVRVDNMTKYDVQAKGYRIAADEPNSQAAIRLNEGSVEVASMSGVVKVFDANGAMLTRIGAGTASSFKPGQTGANAGSAGSNGAVGAISGSNFLLYTAIVSGLAGIGLGTVALVGNNNSSSR